jgi:hypothetical protein
MTVPMPPSIALAKAIAAAMKIDGKEYPLVEIRTTGDLLLEVCFRNTSQLYKSIPKDALLVLRAKKLPISSPKIFYRVRLETLQKNSGYFKVLLKSQFAEAVAVADKLKQLTESGLNPSEVEAHQLPCVKIVDEDTTTKTLGRENIFRDMLRIIHGAVSVTQNALITYFNLPSQEPLTTPFTMHCLTVLVLMADRYDMLPFISRHCQKTLLSHKYPPVPSDKNGEETLRQKILVQLYTDKGPRFAASTKELILRGSLRWNGSDEPTGDEFQTLWWDLPFNLEAELAYRRSCVLKTIASIQNQFLTLYSSRERQCKLGYDSSSSCDSFQLGEMVKFLTRKGLLSLVPFQAVSPDDPEYLWPEAYTGDIEYLIGLLRQCPGYQIDKNHSHCGLRTKLLPALDLIKSFIDSGIGVKLKHWDAGPSYDSWKPSVKAEKSVWIGNGDGEDVDITGRKPKEFDFALVKQRMGWGSGVDATVERECFTAEKWNWMTEIQSTTKTVGEDNLALTVEDIRCAKHMTVPTLGR